MLRRNEERIRWRWRNVQFSAVLVKAAEVKKALLKNATSSDCTCQGRSLGVFSFRFYYSMFSQSVRAVIHSVPPVFASALRAQTSEVLSAVSEIS